MHLDEHVDRPFLWGCFALAGFIFAASFAIDVDLPTSGSCEERGGMVLVMNGGPETPEAYCLKGGRYWAVRVGR